MARIKQQHPHYRLERPDGFSIALTPKGPLPVEPKNASTFTTRTAALLAGAGAGLDVVRVDA